MQFNALVRVQEPFSDVITRVVPFSRRNRFRRNFNQTGRSFWNRLRRQTTRCMNRSRARYQLPNPSACLFSAEDQVTQRIINGRQCENTSPSVVSIEFSYGSFCSGTYISTSPPTVLTAAHCLDGLWSNGQTSAVVSSGEDRVLSVEGYHMPNYDSSTIPIGGNDVAVLVLQQPFSEASPVGLDVRSELFNEQLTLVAGYGPVSYTHLTLPTICSV